MREPYRQRGSSEEMERTNPIVGVVGVLFYLGTGWTADPNPDTERQTSARTLPFEIEGT
jgi:hypothetical protein